MTEDDQERTRTLGGETAPPAEPIPAAWGNFEIREKVGQGAFGEVYRAFDRTLEREVALKLLRGSGRGHDETAILQEARQMARVRHPNVVPVYGVATHEGRVGFWSDFVHGQTLTALLAAQGKLGAREATGIAVDLAKAVSAVHAAGLLHRDIKASNAMREVGGRILLMDFGLTHARTERGSWGGTPGYMAPELVIGEPASVASDIYALGVLLVHLLTGKLPTPGEKLLDVRPDLPKQLATVVERAMHPEPGRRFASAGELIAALGEVDGAAPVAVSRRNWLWAPMAGTVGAALYWFAKRGGNPSASEAHATYAQAQDQLTHYYRPRGVERAMELFQQTIQQDPKFALAYAGLARAHFLQYWQQRDPKQIAPAQAAAAKALALDRNLATVHVTLGRLYTETGRNDLAAQELNEALRLDARSAEAHQGMAELYYRQGRMADVEPALQKAIDLAPEDWRFPNEMGALYSRTGQWEKAIQAQRTALRLSPDNPRAMTNLGLVLRRAGRTSEAIELYRQAIAIEPSFNRYSNLGVALEEVGRYRDAVAALRQAIVLNPAVHYAWGNLASALAQLPDKKAESRAAGEKAIELGEKLRQEDPSNPSVLSEIGLYYARLGDGERALPLLRQAIALAPDDPELYYRAACGSELLGHRREALELLGKALAKGMARATVERNADLKELRADAQFVRLNSVKE